MSKSKSKIIIISGPTAVGKSSFSMELAKKWNTEIISADSRQIYKEMSIGTAKPSIQDQKEIKHHFVDNISIKENFTVGDFMRQGRSLIKELVKSHQKIIVTGGTGLYIKALLDGINEFPNVSFNTIHELEKQYQENGIEELQEEILQKDPYLHATMDLHNHRRVIRALSIMRTSGKPYTHYSEKPAISIDTPYQYFVLNMDREKLYQRINLRVDLMIAAGLVKEAKTLHSSKHLRSLQTVGYQELFDYFDGIYTLPEAIEKIKQHTRNYAKRQLTWFRGVENAIHLDTSKNLQEQINNFV